MTELTVADLLTKANTLQARGLKGSATACCNQAEIAVFGRLITGNEDFTPMPGPLVTGTAVHPPTPDCEYEECGHPQCAEVFDQEMFTEQGDIGQAIRLAAKAAAVFWVGIGWVAVSVVRGWR